MQNQSVNNVLLINKKFLFKLLILNFSFIFIFSCVSFADGRSAASAGYLKTYSNNSYASIGKNSNYYSMQNNASASYNKDTYYDEKKESYYDKKEEYKDDKDSKYGMDELEKSLKNYDTFKKTADLLFDIDNVYNGTTKSCNENNGGCKSSELCIEDDNGKPLCYPENRPCCPEGSYAAEGDACTYEKGCKMGPNEKYCCIRYEIGKPHLRPDDPENRLVCFNESDKPYKTCDNKERNKCHICYYTDMDFKGGIYSCSDKYYCEMENLENEIHQLINDILEHQCFDKEKFDAEAGQFLDDKCNDFFNIFRSVATDIDLLAGEAEWWNVDKGGKEGIVTKIKEIVRALRYEKTIIHRCRYIDGICDNEWKAECHKLDGYKNFAISYSQILGDKLKILKELSDKISEITFRSTFQAQKNNYCDKYEAFRNLAKGSSNCRNWSSKRFAREVFNLNFTRNNYNLVVDYTNKLKEANYCGEIDMEIIDHANGGYGLFLDDIVTECSDDNCKVTNLYHDGCSLFGNINGVMTCLNINDDDDKNNDENKTPCQKLQEQIPDGKNEIIISANQEAGISGWKHPVYYLVISKDRGCYYKNRDCKELENKQCNPNGQNDYDLDSMGFEHRPSLITQTCNDNGERKNMCCVSYSFGLSRFISVPQGLSCDATCDKENTDVACGEKYSCIDANEGVIEKKRECTDQCKILQGETSCGNKFNCYGTILYGTKNCKKNEFCDNKLNNVKCGTPVKCYKNSGELVEEIGKRGCGACEDAAYIQCGQQFYCKMADGSYRYALGSKGCKMCIDETENIQCGKAINCISDYGMTVEDYGTKGCPPCAASEAWRDNHGCVDEFGRYKDKSHWYDGIKQ